ncbi:MAG: CoA transferase [Dehalococcoidia bacterium]
MNDAPARLPLTGIRVLDLSSVWAMPYAAGTLTDLGAEVIKIEALQRLDSSRAGTTNGMWPEGDGGREPWNVPGSFSLINRGKRSLLLNMAGPEGRDVFRELVAISDVVIENFTARVMRDWHLEYEDLKALKPDIIMVSNTGYGHDSPWESYPAQGTALEGTTGIPNFSGYMGGRPWTVGQSYPDFVAMWHGLFSIMACLRRRAITGEGAWIDLGMYQANVGFMGEAMLDYVANGRLGERLGNRDHIQGVQGCYRTLGDDRWFAVATQNDAEWCALRDLIGTAAWGESTPPATLAEARERHDEVDGVIAAWAAARTREDAAQACRSAGLPAGPVNDARDLLLDPHLRARGLYEMVDHAPGTGVGRRPIIGRPYRLSATPLHVRHPAPPLGEANEYVLKELLGMPAARFDDLVAKEITGWREPLAEPVHGLPMQTLLDAGRLRVYDPEYRERLGIVPEQA